jgi:prepilin-type N-terminal cleavage/methylation domain-containing protein
MKKNCGYTLLEVSITLTLFLVLVVFCVKNTQHSPRTTLITALRSLQIEFICLQQQAITSSQSYKINFSPEKNLYQIIQFGKAQTHHLPKNIVFGFFQGAKGSPGKPMHVITQPVKFESPLEHSAIIQSHGKISSGTVYLKHSSDSVMGALTITPHQIARVRLYLLEQGTWKLLGS